MGKDIELASARIPRHALLALAKRVEEGSGPDRDMDWDIAEALGASIRRVTGLGLNGRTPGSMRAFWPHKPNIGRGSEIPRYTKNRTKAAAHLRIVAASTPPQNDLPNHADANQKESPTP